VASNRPRCNWLCAVWDCSVLCADVHHWFLGLEFADMTKEQMLEVIKLLSALESWSFAEKHSLPDYLYEKITESMEVLEAEVLK
jgi:hypothetical protein